MHTSRTRLSILLAAMLLLAAVAAQAQKQPSILLLANGKTDSIVLRWAPTNPVLWQLANQYGYILERFTLTRNGVLLPEPQPERRLLSGAPLKPLGESEWEPLIARNEYAEAVQGLIYEPSEAATDQSWVSILSRRSEQEQRYGFALFLCDMYPELAQAAALRFVDTDVHPNEQYAYRISLPFVPEGLEADTATIVLVPSEAFRMPPITRLQGRFLDRKVDLSWPISLHKGFYTGYTVERSTDSLHFEPITPLPIPPASDSDDDPTTLYYTDSLPANGMRYYYRVRGITPFAELSPPSPVVGGEGMKQFEARPAIDTAYVTTSGQVYLRWRLDSGYLPSVKQVDVFVAENHDGPYTKVNPNPLPPTATELVDAHSSHLNSFYRVHAYGFEPDEMAFSFPYFVQRIDSIPPAPPTVLRGIAYKNGLVSLDWDANTEPDMYGYRVFRGNSEGEEFMEVTTAPLAEPHFRDSINLHTLTSHVYYKVLAMDRRFNPSEYSEVLRLKRPDTIPPAPPVVVRTAVEGTTVRLWLEYSPSRDVDRYEAFRVMEGSQERTLLYSWREQDKPEGLLVDSIVPQGHRFHYAIEVVDSSDNRSEVLSRSFTVETGLRPSITDCKLTVDREKKCVTLAWSYPLAAEVERYYLYRALLNEPLILYKTLDAGTLEYSDTDLSPGNSYTYKLKAVLKNGAESQMSRGWVVKY